MLNLPALGSSKTPTKISRNAQRYPIPSTLCYELPRATHSNCTVQVRTDIATLYIVLMYETTDKVKSSQSQRKRPRISISLAKIPTTPQFQSCPTWTPYLDHE